MTEFIHLQYCGKCASELVKQDNTTYECTQCSTLTFNSPVGAAAVLVYRDDTILLNVRGREPRKGLYDVMGGFMNFMEQPKQTILREFKEETSADLFDLELVDVLTERNTDNQSVLGVYYVGSIKPDAQLTASDDIAEICWISMEKLDDIDLMPEKIELIKRVYQQHKEGHRNHG